MKEWKVGLAGVGGLNRSRAYTIDPRVRVSAVCDVSGEALETAAKAFGLPDGHAYEDYDELVGSDIDIVVIGTPMPAHASQAVKALEAGRHVLSEVTVADTVDGCMAVLDAADRSAGTYMLAENYIYFDYIQVWKKWLEAGRIGSVFHAEGEYVHEIRDLLVNSESGEKRWRYDRPPIIYCTHCLGPLLYLMDDHITRATGIGDGRACVPDGGPGHADMQVGLFETAKGASIKILRSQVAFREPHVVHYSLYGTEGIVENGRAGYQATKGWLYSRGDPSCQDGASEIDCDPIDPAAPPEARRGGHGTSEYYLLRGFLDSLERQVPPPIDIRRGLELTLPGLLALDSIRRGGVWLDVPQVR